MGTKILLTFSLLFAISSAKYNSHWLMSEKNNEIKFACLEELDTTMEELKAGWHADSPPEVNLCFERCVMVKSGLLNEDYEIQEDALAEKISNARFKSENVEAVRNCVKEIQKIAECEDVSKINKCFGGRRSRKE